MTAGQPAGGDEPAAPFEIVCDACGRVAPAAPYTPRCPLCDGTLGFRYPAPALARLRELLQRPPRRMWDLGALLPVQRPAEAVTLDEGGTPLIPAAGSWGCRLWLKDETRNPTGSHKDRALSVAVTRGRELGFGACVIVSAGSTGLSTAAYAARAGMRCALVAPRGTPDERLLPAALYGATVLEAPGSFESAMRLVDELGAARPVYLTSTYRRGNPYQAEGARSIGFEIAAQLAAEGLSADWIVVPTGGGGTAAGIWRAYGELSQAGGAGAPPAPRLATVQPDAYNALERALAGGLESEADLYALGIEESVPTVQAKLLHGVPPDALYALAALRQSGGAAVSVADGAALAAQRRLASGEGIFAEPSAASALAGVERLVAAGTIRPHETVVAIVSGSGFRELAALAGRVPVERQPLTAATLGAATGA